MERKLVQHGSSTLMVSLPKKWIDTHNLVKGDSVRIIGQPDKIIISKKSSIIRKKSTQKHFKEVNYNEMRSFLRWAYQEGYQTIKITYTDPSCLFLIQNISKSIFGFELMDVGDKQCIIKNLALEISVNIDELINKIINIVRSQFILVKNYLEKDIKGKEEEIRVIRDECWKFRNMAYSYFKDTLLSSSFDNYYLCHILEQNSTYLYWMYRSFNNQKILIDKHFLYLYDEIYDYFNGTIKRMRKNDEHFIDYVMKNRDYLFQKCEKNKKNELTLYLGMLVQNIHNPKSIIV